MGTDSLLASKQTIIFFDSKCLLCSRFVWLVLRNSHYKLHFAGFESKVAKEILPFELIHNPSTLVFSVSGSLYFKSVAVFKIISYLNFPLRLFKIFSVFPTSWNDSLYDLVANNRNRWFGKSEQCYLPAAKYKSRFFD